MGSPTTLPHFDGSGRGLDDGDCIHCDACGNLEGWECPVRLRAELDWIRGRLGTVSNELDLRAAVEAVVTRVEATRMIGADLLDARSDNNARSEIIAQYQRVWWMAERWAEGGGARGPEQEELNKVRAEIQRIAVTRLRGQLPHTHVQEG